MTVPVAPVKVERKVKNEYPKFYRETGGAFYQKKELFEQVCAEENLYVPHFLFCVPSLDTCSEFVRSLLRSVTQRF